jgi:hypothetical protein
MPGSSVRRAQPLALDQDPGALLDDGAEAALTPQLSSPLYG